MKPLKLDGPLVSTKWLAENLVNPNLIVLDASIKPVGTTAVTIDKTSKKQIPGSRVFDFDKKVCDQKSPLPHMMPTPENFEKEVRSLGVNPESVIVVYDRQGIYSSPRVYWMFKAMGHDQVAVLDGGLPAWISEGREIEELGSTKILEGRFKAHPKPEMFCDSKVVLDALENNKNKVIDARSAGRFYGRDPEPRAGLRAGHMPNAINIPFSEVISNGKVKSQDLLKNIFDSKVGPDQKIITSCGSGVTACVIALAAQIAGIKDITVYDGSWSEWGLPSGLPVVKD